MALYQAGTGALEPPTCTEPYLYAEQCGKHITGTVSSHPLQPVPLSFFMNRGAEISAHALFGDLFLQWFVVFLTCITSTFYCLVTHGEKL